MSDQTELKAETPIADLDRLREEHCRGCGAPLCGHHLLFSFVLGLKDAPRCATCLAAALDRDPPGLRVHLVSYIRHRACYRTAWEWTGAREGPCPAAQDGASDRQGGPGRSES